MRIGDSAWERSNGEKKELPRERNSFDVFFQLSDSLVRAPSVSPPSFLFKNEKNQTDGRHALLSSARRSNERMAAEFDQFLKDLESQGKVLVKDLDSKQLMVLSEGQLLAAEEEARERRGRGEEEVIAPIPPSARIPEDEQDYEEEEELVVMIEAEAEAEAEAVIAAAEEEAAGAAAAAAVTSSPASHGSGVSGGGGRLLLQSGTAGGSLGGSAPLTAPVSSGGGSQLRPGQQAAFAAAGGTTNASAPAQGRTGAPGAPAAGGGAGGGGGGARPPTDPAQFLYSGPAVGVVVPNTVARVLPQFPPNFNGTRPIVQTNPLALLANGVYQRNIYSGGTSRSPALATVPTPTPPAPAVVYQPGDPINVVRVSSGISDLTNANSALSVVSNWPFNDFRNNFPNQNVASAGSLRTLFCATPITQWCTNTLPVDPSLVNSVFQATQNPNFLIG